MDLNALLAGLWNIVMLVIAWVQEHLQTQEQQLIFAAGLVLILFSAYAAWRARKIAGYKLAVFGIKVGFALLFLAIGWPNAKQLYQDAVAYFGNPLAGLLAVFAAGIFGYEIIARLIPKKKTS